MLHLHPCFHSCSDGRLQPGRAEGTAPSEAEIVKLIFEMYLQPDTGYATIARWLNDHGYTRTVRNEEKPFTAGFIANVLKNPFEELADEIDSLQEEKQDLLVEESNRAGMKQRLDELEAFLTEQTTEMREYDEGLVRQLIEKITVYDDHLAFEFKSGLETEVQM